jgi:hypothetical protein
MKRLPLTTEEERDPMTVFVYALKAPETRRQYPRRFKVFLDFLKLNGSLQDQAKQFLFKARQNPSWAESTFMKFIDYQKERSIRREISESTISNYYKAIIL